MEAIGEDGTYDHESVRPAVDVADSGYTYFEQGDVVRARVTPCFENGKGALLSNLTGGRGLGTTELFVFSPSRNIDARFLYYVTVAEEFTEQGTATLYGAHGVRRVEDQFARDYRAWVPARTRQCAIVGYLDRETARIDALIEARRRMVDLLDERDISLIHELTSRGLREVATFDTGVHWLGAIPTHWQAMQIRRVGYVRRGASPRPIDDPVYFDDNGEYAWVRIADVTDSGRYLTRTTQRLSPLGSNLSAKLAPGSLFISIAGSVGKPMIAKIKCCVHDGFVYFERLRVRPDYLYYLFKASQLFQGLGKLGTQLNLNTETVGGIVIPVPPLAEQDEIVAELDRRLSRANDLRSANLRHIALLQERRQTLITSAVTGQLETLEAT
jgi:type I restriction enzyme S subunit